MILALDDIYPPASTEEELRNRVLDAADATGFEVRQLDVEGDDEHIAGIALYDPEQDKRVMTFDSFLFELEALTFLRWLLINQKLDDSDLENVTKTGLAALSEPFVTSVKAVYADRFVSDDKE